MPTIANLRNAIDAFLDARWIMIVARQDAYKAAHGRYWQGLSTHMTRPVHTNANDGAKKPDAMSRKPTDQAESWMDRFPEWANLDLPASVAIDVYEAPGGQHGWTLTLEVLHNGTLYRRVRNVGVETHREKAWHTVVQVP